MYVSAELNLVRYPACNTALRSWSKLIERERPTKNQAHPVATNTGATNVLLAFGVVGSNRCDSSRVFLGAIRKPVISLISRDQSYPEIVVHGIVLDIRPFTYQQLV
jgi:hypothetical protein